MTKALFETRFSPEECKRRLESATERDVPILADWSFRSAILARIREDSFRLRIRRGLSRNSFDRYFYGRFETTTSGALIHGTFRLDPFVPAFAIVWCAGLIAIAGPNFVWSLTSILQHRPFVEGDPWPGVVVPLIMIAVLMGMLSFASWARPGEAKLREFLRQTLEVNEVEPAA